MHYVYLTWQLSHHGGEDDMCIYILSFFFFRISLRDQWHRLECTLDCNQYFHNIAALFARHDRILRVCFTWIKRLFSLQHPLLNKKDVLTIYVFYLFFNTFSWLCFFNKVSQNYYILSRFWHFENSRLRMYTLHIAKWKKRKGKYQMCH